MAVIDASVAVEFVAGAEHAHLAAERLRAEAGNLWAPHLVDAESGHALRRLADSGQLRAGTARAALDDLAALPIRRVAHGALLHRAWRHRRNLSFYDALYLALAEELDSRVLTFDARFARGAPSTRVEVLLDVAGG
jgi:predicted nucleic acid-binding protein